jgi:hypothetical protein
MFEKDLNWTGYKRWETHDIEKEQLWSCSTQEEIINQLRNEWAVNYKHISFPGTAIYLDDTEKLNSLKTIEDGISAYTDVSAVNYTYNSLGFRGNWELDNNNDVKIGFFGCSFTYGIGVAEQDLFSTIIANNLSVKLGKPCRVYNCGIPGGSAGKATRYYALLSKLIKFDYVIFLMPHTGRMEYPAKSNDQAFSWNIIPNWPDINVQGEKLRSIFYKAIDDTFLNSDYMRNIQHCESIAKSHNSKIYFTSWDQISYEYIYNYYITQDSSKLLPWFQSLEYNISPRKLLARDGLHPGPRSHLEFSKRALEYIK